MDSASSRIDPALARIDRNLDAALRSLFLDVEALPYPQRLWVQRCQHHSPGEEDGLLFALVQAAGLDRGWCVEAGAPAVGSICAGLALERGFHVVALEADPDRADALRVLLDGDARNVEQTAISPRRIDALVASLAAAGREVIVLGVGAGAGGVRAWASGAVAPPIICLPYNPLLGAERRVHVQAPEHPLDGTSIAGVLAVAEPRGYRLAIVEPQTGTGFLLREDAAPEIPAMDPQLALGLRDRSLPGEAAIPEGIDGPLDELRSAGRVIELDQQPLGLG